ncbi:peptidoglycan-binding protein [Isoptericola aurantiacus]|uniref:peptidoglycan-binding protein n=1 Tax=Isoptericola aurantiacus TaxID=3377839 RepID=UPI00383B991B
MSARSQISAALAREMESNPGFYLRPDSAVAWDRATKAFGKQVIITGALRSLETQTRLFTERYDENYTSAGPFGDVRYWNGRRYVRMRGAAAAVPGTSNHGSGDAVDVKTRRDGDDPGHDKAVVFTSWSDRDRVRFLEVAAEYGWRDDEGRRVGELWHLTYYPALDRHRGTAPASTSTKKRKPNRIKTLRRGSRGFPVGLAQHRLRGAKVFTGKTDGIFGPNTEEGVRAFQRKRGLTVDGVIGPHTWYEMAQGAKYRRGGKWRNRVAQRVVGLKGKQADGKIGPQSVERIREVQRWLGVKDDGVLGKKTVNALKKKG